MYYKIIRTYHDPKDDDGSITELDDLSIALMFVASELTDPKIKDAYLLDENGKELRPSKDLIDVYKKQRKVEEMFF